MDKQQMEASPMHPALAHTRGADDTGLAVVTSLPLQPVPGSKECSPSGYTFEQLRRIIDLNINDQLPVELARDLVMNGPSS